MVVPLNLTKTQLEYVLDELDHTIKYALTEFDRVNATQLLKTLEEDLDNADPDLVDADRFVTQANRKQLRLLQKIINPTLVKFHAKLKEALEK